MIPKRRARAGYVATGVDLLTEVDVGTDAGTFHMRRGPYGRYRLVLCLGQVQGHGSDWRRGGRNMY